MMSENAQINFQKFKVNSYLIEKFLCAAQIWVKVSISIILKTSVSNSK